MLLENTDDVWEYLRCEAGFSALTNIKSKKRNALTDQHLEDLLRAAVTQYEPEIKQVAAALQSQPSH